MQNRLTLMEQLNERLTAVEDYLKKLGPAKGLLERIASLENNIYTTKNALTFKEACMYLGISESLLYKLTSTHDIPHYKPRGKLLYFAKEELDNWLLQNKVETIQTISQLAIEQDEMKPYYQQDRYGKRKRF